MKRREKVLVTGGMGYIGSHTVIELYNAGYQPVIIDNLANSEYSVLNGIKKITGQKFDFEYIDVTNPEQTRLTLSKHKDAVGLIHFAALKAVGESVSHPLLYYKTNVGSLVNILESIESIDIPHFIFSSSCTIYGQPDRLPVTESTPFQIANSPYGNTKQIGEDILRDLSEKPNHKIQSISLRYFNPIGAHSSAYIGELPKGVPNNLMPFITQTAIGLRKELKVFGSDYNTKDGTAIRDYIHVVDLAKAHVVALDRLINKKNKSNLEFYNIGTGKGHTVLEVIKSFEKSTGQKLNYKLVNRRPGDVEAIYADTNKAKKLMGWSTKLSLDDMTSSAWKWEQYIRNQ